MITIIRKRLLHNKSYKVLVWAIGIVLAVSLGLPGVMNQSSQGPWVAQINGQEIGYNDFVRKVHEHEQQLQLLRQQYGQYADLFIQAMGFNSDSQSLAFDTLVREELLNQAARAMGFCIHSDHISEKLADSSFLQYELSGLVPFHAVTAQGINMHKLRQHLQRSQLTLSDFDEKVRHVLQRNLIKELILGASYCPSFEQKDRYNQLHTAKKFSILTFSLQDFLAQEKIKPIADQQLQVFFDEENAKTQRYSIPEKRGAIVWTIDPLLYGVTVSDEELKNYYETHKMTAFIETPSKIGVRKILLKGTKDDAVVKKRATDLYDELIKTPTLFEQRAHELSDDKVTAKKGGLIAPFIRGTYDSSFERSAFALKNDGDIAPILITDQGYEIIQRVNKIDPEVKSFNAVKKEIHDTLLHKKFMSTFVEDVRDIIEQRVETNLENFLTAKKAHASTYPPTAYEASKMSEVLFNAKKIGDISYYIDGNKGIIIKLSDIQKKSTPQLGSIKSKVQQDYYEAQARNRMAEKLIQVKKEAAHHSFKELSQMFGAQLHQTNFMQKETPSKDQNLPFESMLRMEKEGLVISQITERHGYVIRLDSLASVKDDDFSAKKMDILNDLEREKGHFYLSGFVASLHRNARIKQNESLLNLQKEYSE